MSNLETNGNQEVTPNHQGAKIIKTKRGIFNTGVLLSFGYYCHTHNRSGEIRTMVPHDVDSQNWQEFVNNQPNDSGCFPKCHKFLEHIKQIGLKSEPEISQTSRIPRKRIRYHPMGLS